MPIEHRPISFVSKVVATLMLVFVPVALWMGVAHAQSFRSGNAATVAPGETVDSTLFASGRTVDIAGTVNGDVFCAGQNVTVTGTVTGDVICAGQTVRVSGTVEGDVRVAGQTVSVGGTIGRNLTAAGQTVTTEGDTRIGGDASLAGEDLVFNGSVVRDAAFGGSTASINGQVGRNVNASAEQVTLGDSSVIIGGLYYTSHNGVRRPSGARVHGQVVRTEPKPGQDQRGQNRGGMAWFALFFITSLLLLSLVLVLIMPQWFQAASNAAMKRLGAVFLTGIITSIVVPIVIIVLFATVIGIPLAILALLVWLVLLLVSGPFAAYLLGRYLLRGRSDNAIWTMLLGAIVLLVVYFIPLLGQVVALLAFWFGLGTVLWQVRYLPRPAYHLHDAGAVSASVKEPGMSELPETDDQNDSKR